MYATSTDGRRLYAEERGAGEPLVLLPGAGQSLRTFLDSGLADLFARHFRVILMDFTGLGQSERVTTMRPEQWAEDVISVLDALGLDRVHLGGSSLGARVAARVAADRPDRVSTLLIDMPILRVDDAQDEEIHAFFSQYATNPLAPSAERWHGPLWHEAMDFFVWVRRSPGFREHYSPISFLAEIVAPTLLCRGDNDHPVHPIAMATEWHRAAKESWLWLEPGATNMALTQACPEKVVTTYARFVAAMAASR